MPLAIGPTGLAGLFHADGEIMLRESRRGVRHSVLLEHHVDLLDRGRTLGDSANRSGSSSTSCGIGDSIGS